MGYIRGWQALPVWNTLKSKFSTPVSILIPARNEEDNIFPCLNAILQQSYPAEMMEIIVIDDHSTDRTGKIVESLTHASVKLIRLADHVEPGTTHSFKKKAIEVAISQAKGDLIVTTDADCVMGPNWLKFLVSCYELKRPKLLAAPVVFHDEKNNFQRFQSLDFLGMMGVTGAGIHRQTMHMCNGANLAYEKAAFYEVNGFEGVDKLASGDDMMLMQKIAKRYPNDIAFLKNTEARTITTPKRTLGSFMQQRIRWATKTSHYQEKQAIKIWAGVWLFCISLLGSLALIPFYGLPMLFLFLAQLTAKATVDYFFLRQMALFFQRPDLVRMKVYIPSIFYELFYVIVIGLLGNIKREYSWKGRKVQ